ncbi:hypothetical protein AgCh_028699 [Apium graveolens]
MVIQTNNLLPLKLLFVCIALSASGILEYSYKDLQKATCNFTALIGEGAFGPVYKAQMLTGEVVAVKMLATDSTQGEKEFHAENMYMLTLLGRLHHRNFVNLIGYCAEKGQHMLIYVYKSKGSLASHLYDNSLEVDRRKELKFSSRIHLQVCLEGGYHILDESTMKISDQRLTPRKLWRQPIGILEVGILSAKGVLPMKMKDGHGSTYAYCVAKYG